MPDKIVTFDDYDRAILQQMQRNSAQSFEELSEATHLSRIAVWRRVMRLQDSGILKARVALLDAQKVGLGLTVFVSISVRSHSKDWADQFTQVIRSLPQVQSAYRTSGH